MKPQSTQRGWWQITDTNCNTRAKKAEVKRGRRRLRSFYLKRYGREAWIKCNNGRYGFSPDKRKIK